MRSKGAAPGEFAALQAGNGITGNSATLSQAVSPHIIERLAAEGIESLRTWRSLPRARRYGIWGIPTHVAKRLDELARQERGA